MALTQRQLKNFGLLDIILTSTLHDKMLK